MHALPGPRTPPPDEGCVRWSKLEVHTHCSRMPPHSKHASEGVSPKEGARACARPRRPRRQKRTNSRALDPGPSKGGRVFITHQRRECQEI
eukprot:1298869-Pyramimonas_sp.AAC.1